MKIKKAVIDGVEREVKVYPQGMRGWKLKRELGTKRFSKRDFKIGEWLADVPKAERIGFLRRCIEAAKREGMVEFWSMRNRRNGFDRSKFRVFPMSENCRCYCCSGVAVLRHHVKPIAYGGRNKKNNCVPLCNPCHLLVHDRIKADPNEGMAETFARVERDYDPAKA